MRVTLCGQSTEGSNTGVVKDPNGAAVADANVTLRNSETGITRNATTNDDGEYVFKRIEPGGYAVTVEASGFKKSVAPDIALKVGAVAEVVTVT
jgi:hypothetical protein